MELMLLYEVKQVNKYCPDCGNISVLEWKRRYSSLPVDKQMALDALDKALSDRSAEYEYFQLRYIKKSNKKPQKGDLFVFSPRDGVFFGGCVANTVLWENESSDKIVVMLFRDKTDDYRNFKFEPHVENLLTSPAIVSKLYWTKGMFYNIGHTENLDLNNYGFYDYMELKHEGRYLDEFGNVLADKPQYTGLWGVYTDTGIAHDVNKELIIDDSLSIL